MQQTNRYILIILGFIVNAALVFTIITPQVVEAGGTETDSGTVGSLCYDPGTQNVQVLTVESSRQGCRNMGFTVIESGQAMPRPVCMVGGKVQALDNNESSRTECRNTGGTVVETGQQLPGFIVPRETPAKNNTSAPSSPEGITDDERAALVDCDGRTNPKQCLDQNPLVKWTLYAINFLAAGVGVIVTIMIIIGGIQYASAGPNPQAIQAAKKKITNAIIALVAFFFLFAFMQYLIPGGIF